MSQGIVLARNIAKQFVDGEIDRLSKFTTIEDGVVENTARGIFAVAGNPVTK